MALSINRLTQVITIPQSYLTLVTGTLYELDTDQFRKDLKGIEASTEGIVESDTHLHNTSVTVAGTTFARTIEMINGYSVEFEDGAYSVRLAGSNNNIFDVENGILVQNTVQVIAQNSAGLISGGEMTDDIALARKYLSNKKKLDPATGIVTVYDDDNVTVLATFRTYSDANHTTPSDGTTILSEDKAV